MSIFKYSKTFIKSVLYPCYPRKTQLKIQDRKLKNLLSYAKENSVYYNKLIPDDLDVTKIKSTNKIDAIDHFDEIVTDKRILIDDIKNKILTNSKSCSLFDGKYSVTMTSGSTGNPSIIIQDENYQITTSVTSFFRHLDGKLPIVFLGGNAPVDIGIEMINKNKKISSLISSKVHIVDLTKEIGELEKELRKIGPAVVISYTGTLTALSTKLINNGLTIKEKMVIVSGEYCSESDKNIIKQAFNGCDVRIIYGCTEGGSMACECKYGHLHIAQDIVKLEAVDENNNVLPYGQKSDKVLLTNLSNYVQPIIRYEIFDSIIVHNGCPCGCKDDWIEIEGRSDENVIFIENDEEITVPSDGIFIVMGEINKDGLIKFRNYQIEVSRNNNILLRLDYYDDVDKEEVNNEVKNVLNDYLSDYGVYNVSYKFEAGAPKVTTRTGKRKRILMLNE